MPDQIDIPLADAAAELKKTWGQAWQLVLTGVLSGRKQNGKWLVSRESIRDYKQSNELDRPSPVVR